STRRSTAVGRSGVLCRRSASEGTDPSGLIPILSADRMVIMFDRGDYFQCATLIAKGSDAALRARQPVGVIMSEVAAVVPWLADRTEALRSWDEVKLLDVKLDRLDRWYTDGLLCLGDAAHAMSPVGGVGINLAVQDAVAAARILGPKLLSHNVTTADLARVQRQRTLPTAVIQGMQRLLHARFIGPAVAGRMNVSNAARAPMALRIFRRIPVLRSVPVVLVARGVIPERVPDFARRT
ncbi:FAD-dependent monooxygenase, partial [Nocardia sp. NPDC004722]